jgi:maleate isomerase
MEREFAAMIQHAKVDITLHTARMPLQNTTIDTLLEMREHANAAAERLAHAGVDIICYGCTSGSLIQGLEFSQGITEELQEKTGIPTVTTSEAVLAARQHLGLTSLSVVTPYTDDLNREEVTFFESAGIKVRSMTGLGIVDNLEIGMYNPANLIPIVHDGASNTEGGVFISCTNLRTLEIIPRLENELQLPVFSSNTASFFLVVTKLKLSYNAPYYGQLLKNL